MKSLFLYFYFLKINIKILRNADVIEIPKNVKRDYSFASYKDQIADLQLRKEIADKNRKAGILTEKQKKAVELELKIEGVIF